MPHYFDEAFNVYYLNDYYKLYDFFVHITLKFKFVLSLEIAISLKTNVSINIFTSNFSNIRPPKGGPHIAVTPLTIPSKPKKSRGIIKSI